MQHRARRVVVPTAALAVAVALGLTATGDAQKTPAQKRLERSRNLPNLIVSAVQEPPDFAAPGDRIRLSVTVANEGNTRARRPTVTRVLLSTGRSPSGGDRRLAGVARIPALAAGQEFTRRFTVTIPSGVAARTYYFVTCADVGNRVRERAERLHNCKLSGQTVDLRPRPAATNGAPGEAGAPGRDGSAGDLRRLERIELPLGRATEFTSGAFGNREGSTSTRELLRVGPVTINAMCRRSTNGDPGFDPDGGGAAPPNTGDPDTPPASTPSGRDNFDEDGDEAKLLLRSDEGTMSFEGQNGPRGNVPAGGGTPGTDGEGQRQFLAIYHDPDPETTRSRGGRQIDPAAENDFENRTAFESTRAYVAHESGVEFIVHAFAGIDVLGVGADRCVFGGTVLVVQG